MPRRVALSAPDDPTRLELVRAFEKAPPEWDVLLWDGSEDFDVLVDAGEGRADNVVRFDRDDPTRAVRDVAAALTRADLRTTVITGARRGTGVTSLALHLSAALATTNETCLLDLDPTSSLRARMGLPQDARHWADVEDGVLAAATPMAAGFRVLLAPPAGTGDATEVLRAAVTRFDHVIVDAPRSPWRGPVLAAASAAILVVPPTPQGVFFAADTLSSYPDVRWSCVVNRLGAGGELTKGDIEARLGRPVSLELPSSPFLRDREDDHRLLTERWSRYFRRVSRLAAAVR